MAVTKAYWTEAELKLAVSELTDVDVHRLQQIARLAARARGGSLDADDILNTALEKVLDGSRSASRETPLVALLAGAMRSISWNDRKRHDNSRVSLINPTDAEAFVDNNTPELDAIYAERRGKLLAMFGDDEMTKLIFEGRYYDGMSTRALTELTSLSETAVETKLKLIRRRLASAVEKGHIA